MKITVSSTGLSALDRPRMPMIALVVFALALAVFFVVLL